AAKLLHTLHNEFRLHGQIFFFIEANLFHNILRDTKLNNIIPNQKIDGKFERIEFLLRDF
ncbi:MAG TPA: hypothetical protein PK195_11525, partial [Ignavibacteriaceae bacterium]|nr:hypothetical protein [Ignavibacteriaceae bacterium]